MILKYIKGHLFFKFNQFLDSRAEIHQIFELFFWNLRHQKVILKLTVATCNLGTLGSKPLWNNIKNPDSGTYKQYI